MRRTKLITKAHWLVALESYLKLRRILTPRSSGPIKPLKWLAVVSRVTKTVFEMQTNSLNLTFSSTFETQVAPWRLRVSNWAANSPIDNQIRMIWWANLKRNDSGIPTLARSYCPLASHWIPVAMASQGSLMKRFISAMSCNREFAGKLVEWRKICVKGLSVGLTNCPIHRETIEGKLVEQPTY